MTSGSFPGNSLAEYILPLAIVAVAVFALFTNGTLFDNFQGAIGGYNRGDVQEGNLVVGRVGSLDGLEITNPDDLKQYYLLEGVSFVEGNTACFADVGCLNIPRVAAGPVAEVDGSLGGTTATQYSRLLLKLAQNLKEKGAPPGLVSRVEKLGDAGMDLGAVLLSYPKGIVPCDNNCGGTSISHTAMLHKNVLVDRFAALSKDLNSFLKTRPDIQESFASATPIVGSATNNILQASSGWVKYAGNGVVYSPRGVYVQTNAKTICKTVNGNTTCPVIR